MLTEWIFPDYWQIMVIVLSSVLHQRSEWRPATLLAAMLFAKGRKTITSRLRAAGISRRCKACYYFIGSPAQKTKAIATELPKMMIRRIGAFHLNLRLHSLVELWAWDKSAKLFCNRSDSPWDDANRRPSHADKCACLRREVLM